MKKKVDSYESGRRIPSCHLNIMWTKSQQPVELHHRVILQGAREPLNFFIIQCGALSVGEFCICMIRPQIYVCETDTIVLDISVILIRFPPKILNH